MIINNIDSRFSLDVQLYNEQPGLNGAITTSITGSLSDLGLDSAYTKVFAAAELVSITKTFNGFPSVDLGGSPVDGDDKQPLLLSSTHAIALQVLEIDPESPGVGYVTVTLEKVGGASASVSTLHVVTGDSIILQTRLGWPWHADTEITITGSSDLAGVKVAFAIVGSSVNTGLGYGYV